MKFFTKSISLLGVFAFVLGLGFSNALMAQTNDLNYTFSNATGTYTPITGGTALGASSWTTTQTYLIALPTPFTFNGSAQTEVYMSTAGFIAFGNINPGTAANGISSSLAFNGVASPFGGTLALPSTMAGAAPELRWEQVGDEIVFQWKDVTRSSQAANERCNFQVRLNTVDNTIKFVYGTFSFVSTSNSVTAVSVGLRGAFTATTTPNYFTRFLSTTTANPGFTRTWDNTTGGPGNSTTCRIAGPAATTFPNMYPASGQTMVWTPKEVTCTPLAITATTSYFEGFEGINGNDSYPTCTQGVQASASSHKIKTYSGTQTTNNRTARTGTNFAAIWGNNSTTAFDRFVSAPIDITAGKLYQASLWYASDNTAVANFTNLTIDYAATPTGASLGTIATLPSTLNTSYQKLTGSLNATTSGTIYLRVSVTCPTTGTYMMFDDLEFKEEPACADISGISISAITNATATLNWAQTTSPGATHEWAFGTSSTPPANGTVVGNTTVSAPLTGLVGNTQYYGFVRSVCGATTGAWTTVQFRTECDATTAFTENFDAVFTGSSAPLPNCIKKLVTGTPPATSPSYVNSGSVSPWSAPNNYYLASNAAYAAWMITQKVSNLNAGTHRLSFVAALQTAGTGTLEVGYITDPTNAATFTPLNTFTLTTNVRGTTRLEVVPSTSAPAEGFLAFKNPGGTTYQVNIDDIAWEPLPTCYVVNNIKATNATENSLTIAWDAPTTGTTPTQFNYEIRTSGAGGSGATGLVVSGNSTNPNATTTATLSPGTIYNIYVRSDCGGGVTSLWNTVPATAYTLCAGVSGLNETFESYATTGAFLPPCWFRNVVGSASFNLSSTTTPVGTRHLTTYSATTAGYGFAHAILPKITNINSGTLQFKAKIKSSPNGDLQFGYVTTPYDMTTFTLLSTIVVTTNAYGGFIDPIALPATLPAEALLCLRHPAATSGLNFYIDDVVVEPIPTCFEPSFNSIKVESITSSSITAAWNAPIGGVPVSYEMKMVLPGAGAAAAAQGAGIASSIGTATTATVTGLVAGTAYDMYIRTFCGGSDYSSWTSVRSVGTACVGVATWMEGFDFYSTSQFPQCWYKLQSGTGSLTLSATTPASAPNNLYFYNSTSSPVNSNKGVVALTPVTNINAGTHQLKMKLRATSAITPAHAFEIGYVMSPFDTASFTTIVRVPVPSNVYGGFTEVPFPTTTPAGAIPAIRHFGNITGGIYIDDMSWEEIPQCSEPNFLGITLNNITPSGIIVNWTAPTVGTPTGYEAKVVGAGQGSGATGQGMVSITGTTATFTGLDENTAYEVYIRTLCGALTSANWTTAKTFRTTCNPKTTLFEDFTSYSTSGGAAPSCWGRLGNNGGFSSSISANMAGFLNTSSATFPGMFILPLFSNVNAGTHQFKAKFAVFSASSAAKAMVGYMTNPADSTTFVSLATFDVSNTTFGAQSVVKFPTSVPAGAYVAIKNPTAPVALYLDDVTWEQQPALDIKPVSIVTPSHALGCYGASQTFVVRVENTGSNTIDFTTSPLTVQVDVTGTATGQSIGTLSTGTLASGLTLDVTATAPIDMSALGTYNLTATTYMTGDLDASNDLSPVFARTTLTEVAAPKFDNFGTSTVLPTGWATRGLGWYASASRGKTGSGVYCNLYATTVNYAELYTYRYTNIIAGYDLSFDARVNNTTPAGTAPAAGWGNLEVQISTDCGATYTTVATYDDINTVGWNSKSVSLTPYIGQTIIVKLRANYTTGSFYVDIDNFNVGDICGSKTGTDALAVGPNTLGEVCSSASSPYTYYGINSAGNQQLCMAIKWGTNTAAKTFAEANNGIKVTNLAANYTNGTGITRTVNLNSFWNVDLGTNAANQLQSPVDIRFYFNKPNYDAVLSTAATFNGATAPVWFKTVGTNFDNVTSPRNGTTGQWNDMVELAASAPTQDGAGNWYVELTGITSFSGGSMAVAANSASPLPISLKSLRAAEKGKVNEIVWETAAESNVRNFVIEKSTDSRNWSSVGSTLPNATKRYVMIDANPAGMTYYRLKNIDDDGREAVSYIVSIERKTGKFTLTRVYPNPSTDNFSVRYETTEDENISVNVFDIFGKLVLSQNVTSQKGLNTLMLETANLTAGTYIMQINNGAATITERIVKQ